MALLALNMQITGQVQGVGFRPFVYNLAQRLSLSGFVANNAQGVSIRAQGAESRLILFKRLLMEEQPAMSQIESIAAEAVAVDPLLLDFSIHISEEGRVDLGVTPDAAVCQACLSELFDPENRRYQYPFINCTHCGPRYSLIKALPYDRKHTTMDKFSLCCDCAQEYEQASDRRFHAQPNACKNCGPKLSLHDERGEPQPSSDPVADTLSLLQQGKIVAIKGIGGFHLVCDAHNETAIARLRSLKHRDSKPFALMGANTQSLDPYVELNEMRQQRLRAMDAPIVLCPRKRVEDSAELSKGTVLSEASVVAETSALPETIAPALAWLGVMLPHSPLHFLLFHKAAGEPIGLDWLESPQQLMLVMTSANRCGNPLVFENHAALKELNGIADGFLLHDRDIFIRSDDSVVNAMGKELALIRRGRGLSPQFIPLPKRFSSSNRSVLAIGAFFKNTVCLTKGDRAYVSQYIGDLDNPDCCRALNKTVEHLKALLAIEPDIVVSDLHPDFYSTQYAQRYSQQSKIPWLQVQHHHAHIAAVMAEHQLNQPVLGLALDGFGLGVDGELWGGELLLVANGESDRLAHLSPLLMPGGEQAAKEPWRMAVGAGYQCGQTETLKMRFAEVEGIDVVLQLLEKQSNCPESSSAGRLFDTVAGLLGVIKINQYEAQAAMELESLAYQYLLDHPWPTEPLLIQQSDSGMLNCLPLLHRLLECSDPAYGAALFHQQFVMALSGWVLAHSEQHSMKEVVLAGGCFLNQLLSEGLKKALVAANLVVYSPEKLPCNDGAISMGQAYVALELDCQRELESSEQQQQQSTSQSESVAADLVEMKVCV